MSSDRARFITDNLPFYTQVIQAYLTRAALYDLSFDPTAYDWVCFLRQGVQS
jgi:hypothetical protein